MPEKKKESDEFTLKTTRTMREKAKVMGRCVITVLKFWRICCKSKKAQK